MPHVAAAGAERKVNEYEGQHRKVSVEPTGEAFKNLSELKTEYIALEKAASTASPQWATHYKAIDRLLTELVGAVSKSPEPGAVGASGGGTQITKVSARRPISSAPPCWYLLA